MGRGKKIHDKNYVNLVFELSKKKNIKFIVNSKFSLKYLKEFNIDVSKIYLKYFGVNIPEHHSLRMKNQYKIWSKTAKHLQLKKMIDYLKTKYTTTSKRYNPLVSTSKLTPHFNGLKLKELVFEFVSRFFISVPYFADH